MERPSKVLNSKLPLPTRTLVMMLNPITTPNPLFRKNEFHHRTVLPKSTKVVVRREVGLVDLITTRTTNRPVSGRRGKRTKGVVKIGPTSWTC